jgi:uncharacterized Fe-S cluster-containing radical SAM superfamily protein
VTDTIPKLPIVEFYITNVCNLACEHCNRFNNYRFRGWQAWQDHAAEYEQWSQLVDFEHISILGGEPLLNPTVLEWCEGIRRLWPKATIHLVSNGYHMNRVAGLRDVLGRNRILLYVGVHNTESHDWITDQVQQFLGPACRKETRDANVTVWRGRASVWVESQVDFVTSSIRRDSAGDLCLYDSDPQQAHDACGFVRSGTHHFIRGRLYKCGPVALMPEFDSQHELKITDQDRALLNSYRPFSAQDFADHSEQVLRAIKQPLPQCKFCPGSHDIHRIAAQPKARATTINIIKRS